MPHFYRRSHSRRETHAFGKAQGDTQTDRTKLLDGELGLKAAQVIPPAPTHEEIAGLAYHFWEQRGGAAGSPWEDWFRAEQELKQRR